MAKDQKLKQWVKLYFTDSKGNKVMMFSMPITKKEYNEFLHRKYYVQGKGRAKKFKPLTKSELREWMKEEKKTFKKSKRGKGK